MRMVASMGMPTCKGAEEAKKNPPRETFKASVKCSVVSEATPTARNRSGVRWLTRASWRRSLGLDRKSTRLNSSHSQISYAVFCLKKKKKKKKKKKRTKKK